jgi:ribosome-associated translation inhibitor RaiA
MKIQINSGHFIKGHEALLEKVSDSVESSLKRISNHITRVEVHLSDEDGDKNGKNDKRCVMEARLKGRQPIAVTHQAETLELAVDGATDKLISMIDSMLGQQRDEKRRVDPSEPNLNEKS